MIGRGSQGAPWKLAQISAELLGQPPVAAPRGAALVALVCEHYDAMLAFYGRDLGGRVARKHLGWYMDRVATPGDLRRRVLTERDPAEVQRLLSDALLAPERRQAA